jgi:hypothetical protein
MTEYIIDTTIENIRHYDVHPNVIYTLHVKIDKMGNVDIRSETNFNNSTCQLLTINDNIPIPYYIINSLKQLFCCPERNKSAIIRGGTNFTGGANSMSHYFNAIECLKILKEDIARLYKPIIDELI